MSNKFVEPFSALGGTYKMFYASAILMDEEIVLQRRKLLVMEKLFAVVVLSGGRQHFRQ